MAARDSHRLNSQVRPSGRRRGARPFWRSRTLRYGVTLAASIAGVLLFLLASASSNTPLFERHYPLLLALNATAAAALLLIVIVLVIRLARRYRAGQFGARMMVRFAVSFGLMGLVPGALIYLVSVQFLGKSIESWFDVRIDNALESGLTIGRTTLDTMLADLNGKARAVAFGMSDVAESQQGQALNRLRQQTGASQALLFSAGGRVLAEAVASGEGDVLLPALPPSNVIRQLRLARSYSAVESTLPEADETSLGAGSSQRDAARVATTDESRGLRLRVVVPVPAQTFLLRPESTYVQLVQEVPASLAANAEAVQNGMRDYQELSLSRTGLQKIYTVTLTLTLLLSMCAALAVAFLLASWLTEPLLLLAEGTKAVAGGDYSPMREILTNDELGTLMQSFNAMVRQLDDARASVDRNRAALVAANTYLESILSNLSAGVLVFDDGFRLLTANDGAARILATPLAPRLGTRLFGPSIDEPRDDASSTSSTADASLRALGKAVEASFADPATVGTDWQRQIELDLGEGSEPLVVLARGSRCPVGSGADRRDGYLVVFDDMTDVIAAQRSVAWAEVARRLAHEIKNPLTPIQLSAERLKMKLEGHVGTARGGGARARRDHDRQPGLRDEADGRRLPRLRQGAADHVECAGPERARRRGHDALRRPRRRPAGSAVAGGRRAGRLTADRDAVARSAAGDRRRDATAAGDPQPRAECPGRDARHAGGARRDRDRHRPVAPPRRRCVRRADGAPERLGQRQRLSS